MVRHCNADAGRLCVRTMKLPSDNYRGSRANVGGYSCVIREFRRVEEDGSNGGTIEVVGGGDYKIRECRRVEGGGSNVGTIEVVGGGGCEKREFR